MEAYVYNADMLCVPCGDNLKREIEAQAIDSFRERNPDAVIDPSDPDDVALALGFDPNDESSFDSDNYPKDGGGEADSPYHCSHCGLFLETPLTSDGYRYVLDAFLDFLVDNTGDRDVTRAWFDFYFDDIPVEDIAEAVSDLIRAKIEGFKAPEPVSAATRELVAAWENGDSAKFGILAKFASIRLDVLDGDCLADVMRIREAEQS